MSRNTKLDIWFSTWGGQIHPEAVVALRNITDSLGNINSQLIDALKDALEHENHEDGKCGCGWTLKAREVLETVVRGGVRI